MSDTLQLIQAAADPDHPMRTVGYVIGRLISFGFAIWGIVGLVRHYTSSRDHQPPTTHAPAVRHRPPPGPVWPAQYYGAIPPRVPPHYGQHPAPPPAYRPSGHGPVHPAPPHHYPDSAPADHNAWMRPQK
jgi:hypothetical protein